MENLMRMIIQIKRQAGKSCAAAQAASASVDVTADAEPQDPYSEHGDDQDPNEHEESSHDGDSNPSLDEIPEDNPEDELEPWVDHIKRATRSADDLLATDRIMSWILRRSRICWRQARMIVKHHEDRWTKLVSN